MELQQKLGKNVDCFVQETFSGWIRWKGSVYFGHGLTQALVNIASSAAFTSLRGKLKITEQQSLVLQDAILCIRVEAIIFFNDMDLYLQ